MKKYPLYLKIIIGIVLGVIWSFFSVYFGFNQFTKDWISPFGDMFIRLLKLIAIPLILFSIASGISSLSNVLILKSMGIKTFAIYMITTFFSISLGLILVNTIAPGTFIDKDKRIDNRLKYEAWVEQTPGVSYIDNKRFLQDQSYDKDKYLSGGDDKSDFVDSKIKIAGETKDEGPLAFIVDIIPENIFLSLGTNSLMLQIIFFAIFFGIALLCIKGKGTNALVNVINSLNEVFIEMVHIVMKFSPFFVFALLAGVMSKMSDDILEIVDIFKGLGIYFLTVTLGLLIMIFVVYPLMMKIIVPKMKYFDFFRKVNTAQFLAFSTSSSAATLPVTIDCVEKNLNVKNRVASFVLPIGATINMDGTSLYQTIAVVFLAQMHMVDLSFANQLIIVFTATLASIGSSAVPSAGLIMLIIILQSVNLNPVWIAIIFPIDRILDMIRTTVNVTGDITVCTLINKMESKKEKV